MIRILDIALKDLMQLARDSKTFVFLVFMPCLLYTSPSPRDCS